MAVVFGTILIVDLRLLGVAGTSRTYVRVHDELVGWTWTAFGLAVITGVLMFLPNASTYFENTPFWWKMFALALAGINMALFERVIARSAPSWDAQTPIPNAARAAALASIAIWTCAIFLGRWIGFTKGYNFDVPEDMDFDFDFLEAGLLLLESCTRLPA